MSNRPQVGMDENNKQLLADIQELLPMQPSHPQRVYYEYQWEGGTDLLMLFGPLAGKLSVKVDWHFTTADAHIKLKHLYPVIQV